MGRFQLGPHDAAPEPHLERVIMLAGAVEESSIALAIQQLLAHDAASKTEPVYLVVSTYGGEIYEMLSLFDAINFVSCPVRTVGLGKIMSAGVLLLAAGEKGSRVIGRNATVMIHPVSGGTGGSVFEMTSGVNESVRLQSALSRLLCQETKITPRKLEEIMRSGGDTFLTAKEAIRYGIADGYVGGDRGRGA
jgi:ATP-dependent Clp protease protease subunit